MTRPAANGTSLARELDLNIKPETFTRKLDAAESLPVGSGLFELRGVLKPNAAGVAAEYQHHISTNVSAFGMGYAGMVLDARSRAWTPEMAAMGGVRIRW